nr:DUF1902 domain-containing protein [uncultured Devosia sp.]
MSQSFTVTVFWDDEAHVWVATSEDIVGLVTESASLDELYARVVAVTPELLDDNRIDPGDGKIDFHIVSQLQQTAAE